MATRKNLEIKHEKELEAFKKSFNVLQSKHLALKKQIVESDRKKFKDGKFPPMPPKRKAPTNVSEAIEQYKMKAFGSDLVPPTPAKLEKKVKEIRAVWAKKAKDEATVKRQMAKDEAEEKARQKKLASDKKKKPAPKRKGLSIINRRKIRK